jgi:hypothetical protein
MVAAGVTIPVLDSDGKQALDNDGKPVLHGKYTGPAFDTALWCINSREDGGLGLLPKRVQERMGHSSITVTHTYGHLFPRGEDAAELAAAEKVLLG